MAGPNSALCDCGTVCHKRLDRWTPLPTGLQLQQQQDNNLLADRDGQYAIKWFVTYQVNRARTVKLLYDSVADKQWLHQIWVCLRLGDTHPERQCTVGGLRGYWFTCIVSYGGHVTYAIAYM